MGDILNDTILEGIWVNGTDKKQITVLFENNDEGTFTVNTNEETELWNRFFKKFEPADVDRFTEKNKQNRVLEDKKREKFKDEEDELKILFEAKLKAFEIDEIQKSENKLLRSKIRKSSNLIELNAWVTALLLESLQKENE